MPVPSAMADPPQAGYAALPIGEASDQCTFTLLVPSSESLPAGCALAPTASLRAERAPNPSIADPVWKDSTVSSGDLNAISYKSDGVPYWTTMRNSCVVLHVHSSCASTTSSSVASSSSDASGASSRPRSLRLKQYLFLDYGPHPTHHAMIPPVGSYVAKTATTPGPRAEFTVGRRACGWLGLDYAGKPIAQLMLKGTCIEVRVTRGSFHDDELVRLCRGLCAVAVGEPPPPPSPLLPSSPLLPLSHRALSPPCFARATYYSRHPSVAHGFLVPASLWANDVSNFGLPHCGYPTWVDAASAPVTVTRRLGKLLALDSYGVLGGRRRGGRGGGGNGSSYAVENEVEGSKGEGKGEEGKTGETAPVEPLETFALYTDADRDSMAWVRTVWSVGPMQEAPRWPPETGA